MHQWVVFELIVWFPGVLHLELQDLVLDWMHLALGILLPALLLFLCVQRTIFTSVFWIVNLLFLSCYSVQCFIFVITVCRFPSNNSDPMGDRMPPPNAWRPTHQPNTVTSFNAGFHGMGPPLMPRSGDMTLPISAVSIYSRILEDISPSLMIIFFFKSCKPTEMLFPIYFIPKCCTFQF